MLAYQGYFENGKFMSNDIVKIPEHKRVIITILDESINRTEKQQAKAWRNFFDAVNSSKETIPESFDRVNIAREINI